MPHGRAHDRHPTQPPWPVRRAGSETLLGIAVNLSERGLLLRCPEPLDRHAVLDLLLDCSDCAPARSPLRLTGEVRWCTRVEPDGNHGCGVQIVAMDRRDTEVVRQLVRLLEPGTA